MKPIKPDFDAAEAAEDEWIHNQTPRPVKPTTLTKKVEKAIRHDEPARQNPPESGKGLGSH